jgi:hypothetical protein
MTWRSVGLQSRLQSTLNICHGLLDIGNGYGDGYIGDGVGGSGVGVGGEQGSANFEDRSYTHGDGDSIDDSSKGDGRSSQ